MDKLKPLVFVAAIIALYYLSYYLYSGVLSPLPPLGDSWDYHIPIAKTILDGSFLTLTDPTLPQWYYPGSAEVLNAIFLLTPLPLSYANILPTVILSFVLFRLGRTYGLAYYPSVLFALSFVTLNVVVRWLNFFLVDAWMAVFFSTLLILLKEPKKTMRYFLVLGVVWGMFIGTKYTSLAFSAVLIVFFGKRLLPAISVQRILVFLIPFLTLGAFWYVRNYVIMGNPFYPLDALGFQGTELFRHDRVWDTALEYPVTMIDSFIAEFKAWVLVVPVAVWYVARALFIRREPMTTVQKLFLLGLVNFALYLSFPTGWEPWIMVSSFRYAYPAVIPLMLGVFLLASSYKKETLLGYFAIGNMLFVTSLHYYPKLVFVFLPLAFVCIHYLQKFEPKKARVALKK